MGHSRYVRQVKTTQAFTESLRTNSNRICMPSAEFAYHVYHRTLAFPLHIMIQTLVKSSL